MGEAILSLMCRLILLLLFASALFSADAIYDGSWVKRFARATAVVMRDAASSGRCSGGTARL